MECQSMTADQTATQNEGTILLHYFLCQYWMISLSSEDIDLRYALKMMTSFLHMPKNRRRASNVSVAYKTCVGVSLHSHVEAFLKILVQSKPFNLVFNVGLPFL